jgi:hypothetical protein
VIGKMSGKPGITFGYPLRDDAGNFVAAVFAATNIRWFDRLTTSYQLPAGWTSVLFSADGEAISRFPSLKVAHRQVAGRKPASTGGGDQGQPAPRPDDRAGRRRAAVRPRAGGTSPTAR